MPIVLVFAPGDVNYIAKLNSIAPLINASESSAESSATAAAASAASATAAQTAVEGAGNNPAIRTSRQTITADAQIPAGENGLSVGPVTINTGITVTVPTDTYWSVI